MTAPSVLRQGDTATWRDDPFTDPSTGRCYASSGGYSLSTIFSVPTGQSGAPITLSGVADGDGWKTSITTTVSDGIAPGTYWWQTVATGNGERVTLRSGTVVVLPNLAAVTGTYDGRSLAERALVDAENALATFSSSGGRVRKYTIGQRTMEFDTAAEILQIINYWKIRVVNERTAASIANGLGNPRRLAVRFR